MKVGDRVVLERMDNDPNPIPVGTEGTIRHIGGGVVNVDWDNGRHIGLIEGIDDFKVIEND